MPDRFEAGRNYRRLAGEASAIFLVFCLVGCQSAPGPPATVSVETVVMPQPATVGPATVAIKLASPQGDPLTNAKLTVEGDMEHPGMAPVFANAEELSAGRYRARLDFGMAGDWVLLLHIKLPNGQTVERQVDVKGVRAK